MQPEGGSTMAQCETCGNDYDRCFRVVSTDNSSHTFDSFECAIQALAPRCVHCGVPVVGHGIDVSGKVYCGAHCAKASGTRGAVDRL
jgi:hypothetical protein